MTNGELAIQFNGIEDVANLYRDTYQLIDNGMWAAGDVLALAHNAGYGLRDILQACASERTVSRATVNNHMRTAIIFPPELRAENVSWTLHMTCGRQAKMNDPSTWAKAHEWLDKVVELGWGKAQLDEAIAAAKGNPKAGEPVYLLRNVEGMVWLDRQLAFDTHRQMTIRVPIEAVNQADWENYGMKVQVTILQPAPEIQQLDAQEAA